MRRVQLGLPVVLIVSLCIWNGCGSRSPMAGESKGPAQAEGHMAVRGQVGEVEAAGLVDLESLKIRDETGRVWAFKAEDFIGMTPSHLREHKTLALLVTVRYVETTEGLMATDVTD